MTINSTSIEEINRKAIKSKNTHGDPIRLQSKLLAVVGDPTNDGRVYVAESAGTVRRVVLKVGENPPLFEQSVYPPKAPVDSECEIDR